MDIYILKEIKWIFVIALGLIVAALGAYHSIGIADRNESFICVGIMAAGLIISLIGQIGQQVTAMEKKE